MRSALLLAAVTRGGCLHLLRALIWPLCLLLLSYSGKYAFAENHSRPQQNTLALCDQRPIRLAFYEHGALYFETAQGPQGIDKEIVDTLMRRSGCKFEVQLMVRARIWADLASGQLDMSVSGIQNPERDRFAWFAHYLTMKNYAIVQRNLPVRQASDFLANPQWQFGAVRAFKHGSQQDQWLQQLREQKRVQESPETDSIFKKLKEKRVEAMFAQPPVYRKKLADLHMQAEVMVQDWTPDESGVPHGLILAKSRFSEVQAQQWRKLIEEMRKDGSLLKIYEHYLPPDEAARLLQF